MLRSKRVVAAPNNSTTASLQQQQQHAQPDQALIDLERQRQQEAEAEKLRIQQQQEQERHAKEQLELSSSLFPLTSPDPDSSFQTRVAQIGEILNAAAEFPNINNYTMAFSFSNSTKSWYTRSNANSNDESAAAVVTMPRNLGDLKIKPLISPPNSSSAPTNRIVVDLQHLNWQIFPADKQFKICRDLCKAVEVAGKRAAVAVANNNNNNSNNGFAQNVAWNSVRFCRRGEMLTHCVVDFFNVEVATAVQRVLTDVRYKASFGEVATAHSSSSSSSVLGTTLIVTDFAQRLHGGSGLEIGDVFKTFAEPLQLFSRKQQQNNNNNNNNDNNSNVPEVSVIPSFEAGVFFVCFKDTKFINALLHCSFSKEILSSLILDCGILVSLTDTDDSDFYSPSKIANVSDTSFLSGSSNQNNSSGSSVHYQEQQAFFNNNNNNVNNFSFQQHQHNFDHFGNITSNNNINNNANNSRFGPYPNDAPGNNSTTISRGGAMGGGLLDDDLALAEIDSSKNVRTTANNNHESFLIIGNELKTGEQDSKVEEDDDGANNKNHIANAAPLFDAPPPAPPSLHAVPAGFNHLSTQQYQYQHHHHHQNEFQYEQQQHHHQHHQYQHQQLTTMPIAASTTAASNTLIYGIPYYAVRCNSIDETMAIFDRLLEINDTRFFAKMLSHPPIFDFRVKNPMLIETNNKRFPRLLQLLTRADILMEMLTNTTNGALAITTNWIHTIELKEGISKIVVSLLTKTAVSVPLTPVLVEMMKALAPSDSASAILERALPQTPSDVEASFLEEHQELLDSFNNNNNNDSVFRPFFAMLLEESPQYSANICKLLQLCHQDHEEILKRLLFGDTSKVESQKTDHDDDDGTLPSFSPESEQRRKYYCSLFEKKEENDEKNETTVKNFGNILRSVLNSRAKTLGGSIPEFLQGLLIDSNNNKIVVSYSFLIFFETIAGIHVISEVEESFIRLLVSKLHSTPPSSNSNEENDQKDGAASSPSSDHQENIANRSKIYSFLQRIAPKLCQDTIRLLVQLATASSSAFDESGIQAWNTLVESGINAKPVEVSASAGLLGPAPVPQHAGFRAIIIPPHSVSSTVAATTEKTSNLPHGHPSIETIKETLAKTLPQNWASEFEQYPKLGIPFALLPIGWKVVPDESTGLYKFSFLSKPQQQQHHFNYRNNYHHQPPPMATITTTTTHHPTANREYKVSPQQFFYSNKLNPSFMFALDSTLNEAKFQEWLQDQSIRNETMDSYTIWKASVRYPEKYETQMKTQSNNNNNNSVDNDPVQVNAATRRNRSNSPNGDHRQEEGQPQQQNAQENNTGKNEDSATAPPVVVQSLFLSPEEALPKLAEWFKLYPANGTPFPVSNFIKAAINNARGMYSFTSNNNSNNSASTTSFHPQTRREYRASPQAIFDQDKTVDVKQFCRENNLQILKFRGYLADQKLRDDEIDKVILEKYDVKYLA